MHGKLFVLSELRLRMKKVVPTQTRVYIRTHAHTYVMASSSQISLQHVLPSGGKTGNYFSLITGQSSEFPAELAGIRSIIGNEVLSLAEFYRDARMLCELSRGIFFSVSCAEKYTGCCGWGMMGSRELTLLCVGVCVCLYMCVYVYVCVRVCVSICGGRRTTLSVASQLPSTFH